jgi:hypothetical protein
MASVALFAILEFLIRRTHLRGAVVRLQSLLLALILGAIDAGCSGDSGAGSTGFGCCELPANPPRCATPLIYGGRKRSADDTCVSGIDGTIPDPSVAGWSKVADEDGCPVWTPPAGAPTVSCGLVADSGVPDTGFGPRDSSTDGSPDGGE